MNQIKRRTFMLHAVAAGATLTGPGLALAAPTNVDAWAECDLMVNKLVANAGWCSSFVKLKG